MLTRCPACDTTFRVGPEQIRVRQGVVRCGRCNAVFNALDHLVDDTALPAEPAAPSHPDLAASDPFAFNPPTDVDVPPAAGLARAPAPDAPQEDAASLEDKLAVHLPADHPPAATERLGVPASWSGAAPFPLIRAEEDGEHAPPSTVEIVEATAAPGATDDWTDHAGPEPYAAEPAAVAGDGLPFDERETDTDALTPAPAAAPRRLVPALWSVLGIVALLAATAQATYLFRSELARAWPATRPWLTAACARLGCEVPLGRDIDLISIDTSEMRPDPEHKSGLLLNVTLRNRAGFVQEYPNLELTLTDAQDAALLRRVFEPREYLGREADPARGFQAGAEQPVTLRLDVGDTPATGYRVFVFYP